MPIFRAGSKVVFFCHVPKCGGSAISRYIIGRFGHIAFLNEAFGSIRDPWTRTSPQHISADDLRRLFPRDFFDEYFAVVRHPVSRTISEYHFQRDFQRAIPQNLSFSDWLRGVTSKYPNNRWLIDNHFRPMCEMVPASTKIFKFEDGFGELVSYFDRLAGDSEGARSIDVYYNRPPNVDVAVPSVADLILINSFYSRDFDRFNYDRPQLDG